MDTKWRFSCILDLPWRPLLAAAGAPGIYEGGLTLYLVAWIVTAAGRDEVWMACS